MARPIVVGMHPTREERGPVELAVMLSCMTEAPLEIVGTFWFDATPAMTATRDFEAKSLSGVQTALEDNVDTSRACHAVNVSAKPGSPAHVIHETAVRVGAGLIVVGSTHRGPVGSATLGTTTDRVLNGAPCPVAIAPRGFDDRGQGLTRVGVAFVDTPEGRAALRAAVSVARHAGASLTIYTAVDSDADAKAEQANTALDRAVAEYRDEVDVEGRVLGARGIGALIEESAGLGLLVTGSRGHGPLKATMLGGVSRRLAREARCPLIVVPRGQDQPLSDLFGESLRSLA
jgi:nucleotide-binding universal stress UspA family protein